jgi:hypothetical protein
MTTAAKANTSFFIRFLLQFSTIKNTFFFFRDLCALSSFQLSF